MKNHGLSSMVSALALIATGVSGQAALAKEFHHKLVMPSASSARANADALAQQSSASPPPALISLQAHLTQAYPTVGVNADGSDLWPCLGRGANPDCADRKSVV